MITVNKSKEIITIKDLIEFLKDYPEETPVLYTDGDRCYNLSIFQGTVKGS